MVVELRTFTVLDFFFFFFFFWGGGEREGGGEAKSYGLITTRNFLLLVLATSLGMNKNHSIYRCISILWVSEKKTKKQKQNKGNTRNKVKINLLNHLMNVIRLESVFVRPNL